MSRLVELQASNGKMILVEPEGVDLVNETEDGCWIRYKGDYMTLKEKYSEAREKILGKEHYLTEKVTAEVVGEARSICTNTRCTECKYRGDGCESKLIADYINGKAEGK